MNAAGRPLVVVLITSPKSAANASPQRDDLSPPGVQKSHVNGRFDRLGPRVCEKRLAQSPRSDPGQAPGRLDLPFGDIERGGMAQPTDLSPDALDDLGMAMAHGRCEDSAEEVQVFPTVNVPHPDTFTFIQNQRLLI